MNEKRSQKWTIAPHAFVCSDARVCIQCGNNGRGGEKGKESGLVQRKCMLC